MNKPYVICHILSSLDGKINGPFMEAETTKAIGAEYRKLREEMEADAWQEATKDFGEIMRKYGGSPLCGRLMLAAFSQLEEETR